MGFCVSSQVFTGNVTVGEALKDMIEELYSGATIISHSVLPITKEFHGVTFTNYELTILYK